MQRITNYIFLLIAVLVSSAGLAGCELIGDILKVGFWAGVIFVVVIVLIIGWIMKKLRGR